MNDQTHNLYFSPFVGAEEEIPLTERSKQD